LYVPALEGWLWVHRDLDDQVQEVHTDAFEDGAKLGDDY